METVGLILSIAALMTALCTLAAFTIKNGLPSTRIPLQPLPIRHTPWPQAVKENTAIGSVVRLKSELQPMVVRDLGDDCAREGGLAAHCLWFSNGNVESRTFPLKCLLVKPIPELPVGPQGAL
jgi:hypothetical protein